jgi:hypothetical protein
VSIGAILGIGIHSATNVEELVQMGLVRKTLSVGTLGLVSFRSKKEKLRRADRARYDAEIALEQEHAAREAAELRVAAAEKRVKHTAAEAARSTRQLEKEKKAKKATRRARRRAAMSELLAGSEPIVRGGAEAVRSAGSDAAKRGRKAGRRARKAAKRATDATRDRAATVTKDVVVPRVEQAAAKLGETIEELTSK